MCFTNELTQILYIVLSFKTGHIWYWKFYFKLLNIVTTLSFKEEINSEIINISFFKHAFIGLIFQAMILSVIYYGHFMAPNTPTATTVTKYSCSFDTLIYVLYLLNIDKPVTWKSDTKGLVNFFNRHGINGQIF